MRRTQAMAWKKAIPGLYLRFGGGGAGKLSSDLSSMNIKKKKKRNQTIQMLTVI